MSATIVARAASAVAGALAQAPAVAPVVERRSRARALPETATTAVTVGPVGADVEQETLGTGGPDLWTVRVAVDCLVRSTGDVDAALDALVQATFERLMSDPTIGGAIPGGLSRPSVTYDFDALDARYASATLFFTARLMTGPTFS